MLKISVSYGPIDATRTKGLVVERLGRSLERLPGDGGRFASGQEPAARRRRDG
jgi:hypothetical protein